MLKIVSFINRVKTKLIIMYYNRLFYEKTGSRANIIGAIHLVNHNIKCGENVWISPGVMIYGNGSIEIGDNVSIGKDTIIYASKENGGIKIGDNTLIAAPLLYYGYRP